MSGAQCCRGWLGYENEIREGGRKIDYCEDGVLLHLWRGLSYRVGDIAIAEIVDKGRRSTNLLPCLDRRLYIFNSAEEAQDRLCSRYRVSMRRNYKERPGSQGNGRREYQSSRKRS